MSASEYGTAPRWLRATVYTATAMAETIEGPAWEVLEYLADSAAYAAYIVVAVL